MTRSGEDLHGRTMVCLGTGADARYAEGLLDCLRQSGVAAAREGTFLIGPAIDAICAPVVLWRIWVPREQRAQARRVLQTYQSRD